MRLAGFWDICMVWCLYADRGEHVPRSMYAGPRVGEVFGWGRGSRCRKQKNKKTGVRGWIPLGPWCGSAWRSSLWALGLRLGAGDGGFLSCGSTGTLQRLAARVREHGPGGIRGACLSPCAVCVGWVVVMLGDARVALRGLASCPPERFGIAAFLTRCCTSSSASSLQLLE